METDCLEIVNLWNTRHNSLSVVAPLLLEIGELASSFSSFVIQHVIRSANVPAHLYAKYACTLLVTESWTGSRPSFLLTSLMADDARSSFVE
uniref:RNase H type-1 domain-containing protein n=1 Tax=Aegilops tauschii subsp. strangulata TaxID=200361 RepID=A0A453JHS9_AEGTS